MKNPPNVRIGNAEKLLVKTYKESSIVEDTRKQKYILKTLKAVLRETHVLKDQSILTIIFHDIISFRYHSHKPLSRRRLITTHH